DMVKRYEECMGQAYSPVETMLVPSSVKDPPKPAKLAPDADLSLKFEHVSFHYPEAGVRPAVRDFSLEIAPGQRIGIVGYSGAGKTTLTKLLLRFMDTTEGSIQLAGTDIRQLRQHDLR